MSVASLIVVVYNQTVDDVPVIKAALNAFVRPEIIVCDNSTHEYGNRAICETLGVCYVDMGIRVFLRHIELASRDAMVIWFVCSMTTPRLIKIISLLWMALTFLHLTGMLIFRLL